MGSAEVLRGVLSRQRFNLFGQSFALFGEVCVPIGNPVDGLVGFGSLQRLHFDLQLSREDLQTRPFVFQEGFFADGFGTGHEGAAPFERLQNLRHALAVVGGFQLGKQVFGLAFECFGDYVRVTELGSFAEPAFEVALLIGRQLEAGLLPDFDVLLVVLTVIGVGSRALVVGEGLRTADFEQFQDQVAEPELMLNAELVERLFAVGLFGFECLHPQLQNPDLDP